MVVANAVAALAEINDVSGRNVFQITSQSLFKLLRALNECTEWGQVPFWFPFWQLYVSTDTTQLNLCYGNSVSPEQGLYVQVNHHAVQYDQQ